MYATLTSKVEGVLYCFFDVVGDNCNLKCWGLEPHWFHDFSVCVYPPVGGRYLQIVAMEHACEYKLVYGCHMYHNPKPILADLGIGIWESWIAILT